jgi:hypothetical protein
MKIIGLALLGIGVVMQVVALVVVRRIIKKDGREKVLWPEVHRFVGTGIALMAVGTWFFLLD